MYDTSLLRKENKNIIRRIMQDGGGYTKQMIAAESGLSVATCNTLLNEMEKEKEVISERKKLQKVGRMSAIFRLNENYESYLCISLEIHQNIRYIHAYVLSVLGEIVEEAKYSSEYLTVSTIEEHIKDFLDEYSNIVQIIIGTPSVADQGIIRHCDIPELENEPLEEKLKAAFSLPVHMENDMHYMVYGYYRKKGCRDDIITLAYYPSNILPGTASIYRGTVIRGKNGFAGAAGFLPYGISREQQLQILEKNSCLPVITRSVTSIITLINPDKIVFTGDLLDEKMLDNVRTECIKVIPEDYMPEFIFEESVGEYYLEGMYQRTLELKGVYNDRT